MKQEHKKYILDNINKSSQKIAQELDIPERKVKKFLQQARPLKFPEPLNKGFLLFSCALMVVLGIMVYSNSFRCAFHFDDFQFIADNSAIKNIDLQEIWKYYPCRFFTFLSLALNYHFNGLNVVGYHAVNLGVHLLSAIMVWWLVLLTLSTPGMREEKISRHAGLMALFAGLIFVAHPVQTEAVTNIWQRTASMATLFYVLALNLYVKSRLLQEEPASKFYYAGSLAVALVAMFTKETTITLPLLILLYEFMFFKKEGPLKWGPLLPFLMALLVIPSVTFLTGSEKVSYIHGSVNVPGGLSPMQYTLTQFRVMVTYIRLLFLPLNQNMDYDYPISRSIFEAPTLLSFLFLIGILFFAQRLLARYRLLSFSILWFFLTSLPEANPFPVKDVIFEHRLYLPLVGYSIFLVSGVYYLWGKNSIKTMVIALAVIIAFNSILTYQRNKVWKNEITLWKDVIAKSPHKARAYNDLGEYYRNHNDLARALLNYNKVIELQPNTKTYSNRGTIYATEGNYNQAIKDYDKAIELGPDFALAYKNRGSSYLKEGRLTQGIADLSKAIELGDHGADAYENLGVAYGAEGNFTKAIADFSKVIELKGDDAQAYNNRGYAYSCKGIYGKAILDYNKAIELQPHLIQAYVNRARAYDARKEYGKAQLDMGKAQELKNER